MQRNTVAYDEDQPRVLEEALVLHDAISDLPAVRSSYLKLSYSLTVEQISDLVLCYRSQMIKQVKKCRTESLLEQISKDILGQRNMVYHYSQTLYAVNIHINFFIDLGFVSRFGIQHSCRCRIKNKNNCCDVKCFFASCFIWVFLV